MDYSSIKTGLEGFVERYDSQTFIGSYRETNRSSLLNDGLSTRANSLWKMAEYVVAKYDNTTYPIDNYIKGWKQLASGANNQYLLIEEAKEVWAVYNAQGERLGGEDYIRILFEKKKKQRSFSNIIESGNTKDSPQPIQQIYYGAPGTGKSHEIKEKTKGKSVIRTTFHPDSDYSTFVGAYKPTMEDAETMVVPVVVNNGISLQEKGTFREKRIVYKFIMQAFLKAYLGAWKKYADRKSDEVAPQFLVIEEINRGNCAQIFGDLFQLLDRNDEHFSEYPIESDTDLQKEIERAFKEHKNYKLEHDIDVEDVIEDYTSNYDATLSEDIQHGRVLLLPSNLYIWATMNTSDQSLFPIDSAFKRRWEWKYIPIDTKKESWSIAVDGENYSWTSFLEIINERVFKATSSEDKQLGFYFCKAQNNVVSAETFVSKVLFYLWNDVFKDYDEGDSIFKDSEGKQLSFSKFYNTDGSINNAMVKKLLTALEIERSVDLVEADKDGNNFDCYSLNGSEPKGKSDLGLSIMEQYLSEHSGANFDEIKQAFPDSMLGNVANRGLIVEESTPLDSYSRYYTPKSFTSADGIRYRIYKQWTVSNIGNIIGFAREQGWNVEQRERKDNQA